MNFSYVKFPKLPDEFIKPCLDMIKGKTCKIKTSTKENRFHLVMIIKD